MNEYVMHTDITPVIDISNLSCIWSHWTTMSKKVTLYIWQHDLGWHHTNTNYTFVDIA